MLTLTQPDQATQSDFVDNGAVFGGGAERLDGSTFFVDDDKLEGLVNRADSGIYGEGDELTMYVKQPTIQRTSPLMAEQAFPIDPDSKAAGFGYKFIDLLDLTPVGQANFIKALATSR